MMGRLPLGDVSPYVKTSSGGSADSLRFYATSYATAYGQEGFRPRIGCHSGAGYKSNYRPVVSYKPSLDKLDNPADNYETVTTKHFRPLQLPDGKYPLPWSVYQSGSGYVREKPISFPTTKAVKRVHFDTRDQGAQGIIGLEPKHTPVLHKSQGKGSADGENARHGPHYMSTEYNSKFRFNIPGQPDFLQKTTIGAKEETGFTEGSLQNPIVFKPPSQILPEELVSGIHSPCFHPHFNSKLVWERTGFSINNLNYVTPAHDPNLPNRYLTSYNSRFYDKTLKGVDREGWTRGGIQPQQAGGFATNYHISDLGSDPNATETLRRVHPHVGRTVTTVDPFYRDAPHDYHFAAFHQTSVPN
uniref:Stabilizer of axonemal microtubules 4 n=1 Tax=Sphenodon punctatus TaxID=8508 RepID=A0A8D0HKV4_SPHPU